MLLRLPPGLETNPKINEEMEKEEREKESDQIRTYRWFNQRHAKREGRKRNSYRRNGVDQYMQRSSIHEPKRRRKNTNMGKNDRHNMNS